MAAVSALIAGVAIGAALLSAAAAPGAAAGRVRSDMTVVSTWKGALPGMQLTSGSLRGDSGRGYIVLQRRDMGPVVFSTPEGAGALRLVSWFGDGWTFESQDGSLAIVSFTGEGPSSDPAFTFLGRPLDPASLGAIGTRGVAIPVAYGPWVKGTKPGMQRRSQTAVALVAQTPDGWKPLGYLPGYSVPRGMSRLDALHRPLLGPDGRLYSISPQAGRLVSLMRVWRNPPAPLHPKFGCSNWPATGRGTYRACPNSIVRSAADGGAVTLLHRHVQNGLAAYTDWGLVSPSPDGKWLLLEDQMSSCGTATWADFLPARGGKLARALPQASASEALGWLPDSSALVAGQTQGCAGSPPAGVYQVWPGSLRVPQLVFAATSEDATTWGFSG